MFANTVTIIVFCTLKSTTLEVHKEKAQKQINMSMSVSKQDEQTKMFSDELIIRQYCTSADTQHFMGKETNGIS